MFKNDQAKASTAAEVVKVPNYGAIKIDEAKGKLEQLKRFKNLTITQIKTETDDVENKRRVLEEKLKRERANKIQNEVITSHKKNVEIDWNWQELEEKEDCKELDTDIKKQILECKKIIEDKDMLKEEFEAALQSKDKHYVKQIQVMNQHVDELIQRMSKQFLEMRTDYGTKLQEIESEFERERAALLKQNDEEIKALFDKHQKTEEKFLKLKTQQEEQQSADLENQKSYDANNQTEQKIKLEKEMQILEKCMEDMKAVYRLNEEKLDFNTKVLNERAAVNTKTKDTLKKKKRRYVENVSKVKKQYADELSQFQKTNNKHTVDFKRFTKQFKELQKKFERFEKSDNARLNEIWQMNETEAKAIVEKIMHADKVIHTQQLDIPWKPPSDPIFRQMSRSVTGLDPNEIQQAESQAQSQVEANTQSRSELVQEVSQQDSQANDRPENQVKFEKIKNVFKMLIEEAQYLIDERAFERCETASPKEQFSIKIDSIRKSLGIESMEDVQLLVDICYGFESKFQKELDEKIQREMQDLEAQALEMGLPLAPVENQRRQSQEEIDAERAEAERDPTRLTLNPDHLVMALEQFYKDKEDNAIQQQLIGVPTKKKANFESEEQKAERDKKKQKMFWEKLTTILTPQKLSVWKALDKTLGQYHEMLSKRQNLIEETGLLNQQNEELKTLLNQYLQAGVNQELQVPPTQVIRLDI